jgi:hypothetical protein
VLLCDSPEEAAAAEHLLHYVYGLLLPEDAEVAVRVLLLANKHQLEVQEIMEQLEAIPFTKDAVQLLPALAHLELPIEVRVLLQVRLSEEQLVQLRDHT